MIMKRKRPIQHIRRLKNGKRILINKGVFNLANKVKKDIRKYTKRIEIAGSIRRKTGKYNDIDIVAISDKEGKEKIRQYLKNKGKLIQDGDFKKAGMINGVKTEIYFTEPKSWGSMLYFATGPGDANIGRRTWAKERGLLLNQNGVFDRKTGKYLGGRSEKEVLDLLKRPFKKPELRGKRNFGFIVTKKQILPSDEKEQKLFEDVHKILERVSPGLSPEEKYKKLSEFRFNKAIKKRILSDEKEQKLFEDVHKILEREKHEQKLFEDVHKKLEREKHKKLSGFVVFGEPPKKKKKNFGMGWSIGTKTDPDFAEGKWGKEDVYLKRRVLMDPDVFLRRQYRQRNAADKGTSFEEWNDASPAQVKQIKKGIVSKKDRIPIPIEEFTPYGEMKKFQEGRHRGNAAKELGQRIPVLQVRKKFAPWDRAAPNKPFKDKFHTKPKNIDNQWERETGKFPLDKGEIGEDEADKENDN